MNTHSIVFALILYSLSIECKLKGVFIFMRHGVRAPISTYPLDPHINDTNRWPNGLSQLTDVGIKQAINVGKFLREKYRDFYPKNHKNSILRSTNVDRCLDTIALVSGQLWPPNGKENWIQPRVFKLPMPFDPLFYSPFCPNADINYDKNLNKSEVIAFNEEHQWLYNYVSNYTGLPATLLGTITAQDVLGSAKSNGYSLPEWAKDDIFNKIDFIYFKYIDFVFSGELTLKLSTGLLLKDVSKGMAEVLSSSVETQRWYKNFFIYSTHDYEVFPLNKALGIKQSAHPSFLAFIVFELHETDTGKIVKMYYYNETESLPIGGTQVKPSFCSDIDCPYNEFIRSISNFFPNWKSDCGIPKDFDPYPVMEKYLTITNDSDIYNPDTILN